MWPTIKEENQLTEKDLEIIEIMGFETRLKIFIVYIINMLKDIEEKRT